MMIIIMQYNLYIYIYIIIKAYLPKKEKQKSVCVIVFMYKHICAYVCVKGHTLSGQKNAPLPRQHMAPRLMTYTIL